MAVSTAVFAQDNQDQTNEKSQSEKSDKTLNTQNNKSIQKKKIGVDQSDFMPSSHHFGVVTSYILRYNNLEQVKYKAIQHQLTIAGTYSFDEFWSSYASMALYHETYQDKIFRPNNTDRFHSLSDINLGLVYSKMKPLSFVRRSSNTLNITLPTSEQSQEDQQVTNISLSNFMQSHSWKNFALFNRFLINYGWNRLKYSRTTDLINNDWTLMNSFGLNYVPTPLFGLRASFNMSTTRYLNDVWNMGFGNGFAIFSNWQGFQFYASMVNQSYPEKYRIDPIYFDRYRQLFSAGVTYAF